MVQWLGLCVFTAEGPGSIPGQGTNILCKLGGMAKKKKKKKNLQLGAIYDPESKPSSDTHLPVP